MEHPEDAALCQHLLRAGLVAVGDLVACAEAQRAARRRGEPAPRLGELLLRRGVLCEEALAKAQRAAGRWRSRTRRKRRLARSSGRWRPGWGSREHDGVGPNDLLGTYRINEPIARGSMGAVFSARCERTGKAVALKVLAGERARRDRGAERFLQEAQLLCTLRHENLVRGIAFGTDAGRRYFVMEYFPAPSLKHRIRERGALDEEFVVAVGLRVASALAYLHGEGVVHRDVKPANVLVADDGRTRLCDLGLARELDLPSEATASTDTLGTPRYMAPEQARDGRSAGPSADLYSLGVTLFHAAAGAPPFPEESGIVAVSRHLFDEVPDVRVARPGVSSGLARLIHRLTRKDPGERPRSADEVVAALAALRARREGARRRAA
ncbi:MAG: serine/threonine protein kinase [Planctomycetota bacterium]|nr:MAG: serine/threonine protein kinase [Planctomycetota bacterium]